ncbi:DUF4401 domain-containing protein [Pusillimonas sp. TS35]|nr:DUF4401 domain-containing protein [Pusillimonas sp. TS35]
MQVGSHHLVFRQSPDWRAFLRKTALAMACLLLAAALVCWIAANWPRVTNLQKLAGLQGLLVLLTLLAGWAGLRSSGGQARNTSPAAILMALAAVAAGALLAVIGQIYQTGADSWQLFILWALLLVPWFLARPTVVMGLLLAVLINLGTGRYLYISPAGPAFWMPGPATHVPMILAALNLALLAAWEALIARLDDRWRLGPRLLAAAVAGAFCTAALAGVGGRPGAWPAALTGIAVMAALYAVYRWRRRDHVVVAVAMAGVFVLLAIPAVEAVRGTGTLALAIALLLAVALLAIRHLSRMAGSRGAPGAGSLWFVALFRFLAVSVVAILLIALLAMTLDIPESFVWVAGLALAAAGGLLYRSEPFRALGPPWRDAASPPSAIVPATPAAALPDTTPRLSWLRRVGPEVMRDMAVVLGVTGAVLFSFGIFFAEYQPFFALLLLGGGGVLLYLLLPGGVFRAVCAFAVLATIAVLSWPDGVPGVVSGLDAATSGWLYHVYVRVWLFTMLAVLALVAAVRPGGRAIWAPLACALILLAQFGAAFAPAPTLLASAMPPALWMLWAAFAVLPPLALGVLLQLGTHNRVLRLGAPLALAVASTGWLGAPGISIALLWVLFGYALSSRVLLAFGAAALLAYLGVFYFQIQATLLQKALVLAATGAWLLLCWAGLRRAGTAAGRGGQSEARPPRSALAAFAGPVAGLLVVLGVANGLIYQREQILAHGQRVVLALAPVDPRALIQGDYMALDFAVARQAYGQIMRQSDAAWLWRRGYLRLRPDGQGVFQLVGLQHAPQEGVAQEGDTVLAFWLRGGQLRLATDAWFFPEGQAARYAPARYGVFAVDRRGSALLTGLLDAQLKPIAPR